MNSVKTLLNAKKKELWTIGPRSKVIDALRLMNEKHIGALPVTIEDRLVGIFSERDLVRKTAETAAFSADTMVLELMSRNVLIVHPETTVEDCMNLMTDKHVRHLPVIQDRVLVGVVSIGDVIKEVISRQKRHISALEEYISGSYGADTAELLRDNPPT